MNEVITHHNTEAFVQKKEDRRYQRESPMYYTGGSSLSLKNRPNHPKDMWGKNPTTLWELVIPLYLNKLDSDLRGRRKEENDKLEQEVSNGDTKRISCNRPQGLDNVWTSQGSPSLY